MKNLKISIIIPTKNEQKNISSCLKSCTSQDYPSLEIIVIDNYSTDRTLDIAQKFTQNLYLKGSERSAQRNFGATVAKGNFLLFIDADMTLEKDLVTSCIKTAINNKLKALIIPENPKGKGFWANCIALERKCYFGDDTLESPRFFEKDLFLAIGGYDQNLIAAEDWDITERIKQSGLIIGRTNKYLNHHEKNSFWELIRKKYYYAQNISSYAKKQPKTFIKQMNLIFRPALLRNWKLLLKHPQYALGILILKVTQSISGVIGIINIK